MDCSTPGIFVFHISQSFLKLMSMVSVMPFNNLILCHSLLLLLQSFPASGSFLMSRHFTSGSQSTGASVSKSVLPVYIQDWFPLGWTGWISLLSKGLSKSLLQHHRSKASILLYSAFFTVQLTSIYDYWKNHSFDQMDLCLQSNVSAF